MDQMVQNFLTNHRVSVFSLLRDEHSIDSAALHYAHSDEPFTFYFLTDKASRKVQALHPGKSNTAAVVIGFDESEFATFQAEGDVQIVQDEESWHVYTAKLPDRKRLQSDPTILMLKFTPTWWRFTDMKTKPKTVISG